ncbi:DUF1801 domain-containing protein [Demequina sp.]|uniref:DUF1801 domain-containing protein n=1 Tax=Demequina sp. TaxID=2050685 RepID=UPI003D10D7EC
MTSPEVDTWMTRYDNPMRDVVQRLRQIMLQSDERLDECIKWQTPTFVYKGYLASFYPKPTAVATLVFHAGRAIPGTFPSLEPAGHEGLALRVVSIAEAEEHREELERIVSAWITLQDKVR